MEAAPPSRLPRPLILIGKILALLIVVVLFYFTWRVFFYYRLIANGAIINLPQYTSKLTLGNVAHAAGAAPVTDVTSTDDPVTGSPDAPVTIVVFADFECPFSRDVFPTVRSLAASRPNDVRVIFRDFPLESIHTQARAAARAANCADAQDKYLPMHDKLYQNAERLTDTDLDFYAQQIGLDLTAFNRCMTDPATDREIDEDIADGSAAGVRGTPTFFINGARVEGAIPASILTTVVDQVIAGKKS